MNASIKTNEEFSLAANTLLFLRVSATTLTIVSAIGRLAVECSNPSFALRDFLADRRSEFDRGKTYGRNPLSYTVLATGFSEHQRPDGLPVIDNVPVREGWFLLETTRERDYYPWQSLQIVAITRTQRLIIGFASIIFELSFALGTNLKSQFRLITDGAKCCHCTVHAVSAYLNWLPSTRVYCERIREIPGLPDLNTCEAVKDFSVLPEHAEFKSKVPSRPMARGIDIGD